jgi:diacylglycerol kinase family enzyme
MAGVGFDALVIRDATTHMKHVLGRSAYVWAAAKNLRTKPFEAEIEVDGKEWYEGPASLVLFGNVGKAFAGVKAFDDASPEDGLLEIGVGSADGIAQWGRTLARSAFSSAIKSPFVHVTKGRSVDGSWTVRSCTSSTVATAREREGSASTSSRVRSPSAFRKRRRDRDVRRGFQPAHTHGNSESY